MTDSGDNQTLGRRAFLRRGAFAAAGVAAAPLLGVLASGCDPRQSSVSAASTTTPPVETIPDEAPPSPAAPATVGGATLRPPAVPLAVRDPYVSAWLCGTELTGTWATGWNKPTMAVCGLARIDGRAWLWCGTPELSGVDLHRMEQRTLEVTPTRSLFTLEGGGVQLVVEWLSPITPGDLKTQSAPLALLTVTVSATDGKHHDVALYCDVTGQWASWTDDAAIVWKTAETRARHWEIQLAEQVPLAEVNEMAAWGSAVFSTLPVGAGLTYQSGVDISVRSGFASKGKLTNAVDTRYRAVGDDTPVFGLSHHLGSVGADAASAHWSFGHVATPSVEYMHQTLDPLWTTYWPSWSAMVDDFLASAPTERSRAVSLDAKVTAAAKKAGGSSYSALCALAARQAYGGIQLVRGPGGRPWAFVKEISSDGDMSTMDILLDCCAVWLHLDPPLVAMLLEPMLEYATSSRWTEAYIPHGLGSWPLANGNLTGAASEPMPVEVTSAVLVMAACYAARVPATTAEAYLAPYRTHWSKWADLLVSQLPSPPLQLTTIDILGPMAGNVNLAALGLVGVGAASQILDRLGDTAKAEALAADGERLVVEWAKDAADAKAAHLDLDIGATGTWAPLWNCFWDRAVGTGYIPASVATAQADWYQAQVSAYGLPIQSTYPSYARLDLQAWTAAWLYDHPFGPELVEILARYVGHTDHLAPLPDTYDPRTGNEGTEYNWRGRPVVGGVYALLLVR